MKTLHHFCCQMLCTMVCHDSYGRHLTRAWPLCAHTSFGSHHALFLDNLCPRNTFLLTPRRVSHHPWYHNNLCPTPLSAPLHLCLTTPCVPHHPLSSHHPWQQITLCLTPLFVPTPRCVPHNLCPTPSFVPTPLSVSDHPLPYTTLCPPHHPVLHHP